MAVFKPMIIQKNETDIGKVVRQLYRFSEDLKYTISNLSLEDNISNDVLNSITDRNNKVRKIQFSTDALNIEYDDYASSVQTKLSQSSESIQLLVATGNVVHEMLTRMEMYGEYIRLTSGHLIIDAQNMKLDKPGNAYFSGNITGGSININNRFAVSPSGDVYIDDALTTTTLNPAKAIVAANMEIYNDDDYINVIGKAATCSELYVSENLNCRKVRYTSDKRKKQCIKDIEKADFAGLIPVSYSFRDSGNRAIGYIAQDVYLTQENGKNALGVNRSGKYLELPYVVYSALYAKGIQENQKRINKLKEQIKKVRDVKL